MAFNNAGTLLATCGEWESIITIWDIETKTELAQFKHFEFINSIVFNPKRAILASASNYNTIKLWNLEDYTELAIF